VKDYLRGSNPRISSSEQMVKTTPPGHGSRLLRITEENPLYDHFARPVDNIRLLVTGPFSQDDLGLKCYHSKVGAVELILNHLVDGPNEYAIVDMTAGADSFASGLFTRFDLTCAVVEPTVKSLSVYQQYKTYAHDYGIAICAIGNKIEGEDDIAFLREQVGDDLLTCFGHSSYVRAMEKGRYQPLSQLEEHNTQALSLIRQAVDACQKDWDTFYAQAVAFHQKNALSWANAMVGEDLTTQIDPTFSLKAHVMEHVLSA
jgi:CO dehydrogenase maturation factor